MTKKSIFILDDEIDVCVLLGGFLRNKNYEIASANSIKDGKRILQEFSPDVAILDINLPDGLGFELIPALRKQNNPGIIIISAREGEEEKKLSKHYEVDAYLLKPFNRNDVLHIVENITQV